MYKWKNIWFLTMQADYQMGNLNSTILYLNVSKYLGLTFCSSGSIMFAQEELYNKASKAYSKLSKRPPFIKSWASYKYACI